MKTIIDAVNELRGDLENSRNGCAVGSSLVLFGRHNYKFYTADFFYGMDGWSQVCTIEEFNAMVAEMSEGFEEYKREYNSMQKTVTVDGMVYEIGKLYEFQHDEEEEWHAGILELVREREHLRFESTADFFYKIRECQSRIGTITPAPINLEVGQLYLFDNGSRTGIVGRHYMSAFDKPMFDFVNSGSFIEVAKCTNIIPLVPEVT